MSAAVTAAVAGIAAVGATVYAADQASSATRDASNAAIGQQQSALAQQAALSAPYRNLGQSAIPTLQALLGLSKGSNSASMEKALAATPGYQFAKQQGLDATKNQAASMGLALSGNTLQALDQFGTGLADQTYQQQVGNFENVVGMGQAAAAGQAANIGNAAANTSNLLVNQGNTLAAIQANQAAGISKAIGGAANNYMQYQTLQALNNPASMNNPGNYGAPAGWSQAQGGDLTYQQQEAAGF